MIGLLILIATQATSGASPPPVNFKVTTQWDMTFQLPAEPAETAADGTLIVTARRPYRLRMTTRYDKKALVRTCRIDRPFGVPAIDAIMCDDTLACEATNTTRRAARDCLLARLTPALQRHFNLPPQ